ncbi:Hpt domain-containing protein [bacterium]|nr:Hpt domain-containing protein [bacterium]MBU1989320.1 Hpt domain-containing protein [bacterium]
MLIYNYKKEFIGIDDHDLDSLGFSDLQGLLSEAADFADLFVKTPGYIHNFKHVHWIDFITCAESAEDSKVIIHANNKNYKCTLGINTIYLLDHPSKKAYIVNLGNVRELTHKENEQIAGDLLERPAPKTIAPGSLMAEKIEEADDFADTREVEIKQQPKALQDEYEFSAEEELIDEFDSEPAFDEDIYEDTAYHKPKEPLTTPSTDFIKEEETTLEAQEETDEDFKLDIDDVHIELEDTQAKEIPATEEKDLEPESDYVYDPHVASDELGLPVDLIEEFIQDFINQAKEFKDDLYKSLEEADIDNVKVLSHKLKGVAANLRIEDAFEALVIINTSADHTVIRNSLNKFYRIISKLSGEELQEAPVNNVTAVEEDKVADLPSEELPHKEDDDLLIDFKEDTLASNTEDDLYIDTQDAPHEFKEKEIDDSEVPDKIEMLELADDDFLHNDNQPEEKKDLDYEEIALLDDDAIATENAEEYKEELSFEEDAQSELQLQDDLEEFTTDAMDEEDSQLKFKDEIPELQDVIPDSFDEEDTYEFDLQHDEEAKLDEEPKQEEILPKINYNKTLVAGEIGIGIESFNALFQDYLEEANTSLNSIRDAIEQDDMNRSKKAAIQLKGMSDNMRIHNFTQELETIMSTTDVDLAKECAAAIGTKLNQISNLEG